MAEFCKACAEELRAKQSDFIGICGSEDMAQVLCEGCGNIWVDTEGRCLSRDCFKKDQPGHGEKIKIRIRIQARY